MTLTEVDGNITSIYDGKLLNTQTFTYDALNRLTSAVSTGGPSYYALENTTYNAQTGNLASKAGVSYTYADTAHKHAVTSLSNGNVYTYDANGNQVTRKVGGVTHTLTYDAENRLTKVMNGSTTIATFVYDADGQRVKSTLNGVTTTFVGNYYEKTGTNITKYYYMGTTRVAMRNSTVKYLFGDQLGSTSVTTSSSGAIGSQERYKPFGEMYYSSGTLPTRYTFTGQYSYTINTNEIGLMYYGARFYDPSLGRFASADTIIPGAGNPQSWDRYSYVNNSPLMYTDPSGHWYKPGEIGLVDGQDSGQNWIDYGATCDISDPPYLDYGTQLDMGEFSFNGTPNQESSSYGQQAEEEYTGFSSSGAGQPTIGDRLGLLNFFLVLARDNTNIEESVGGRFDLNSKIYVEIIDGELQVNAISIENNYYEPAQVQAVYLQKSDKVNGIMERKNILLSNSNSANQFINSGERIFIQLKTYKIYSGQTFTVSAYVVARDGCYSEPSRTWLYK